MRFRRLEFLRYGVFADQAFDFGDGKVDLHLIVGPNEAGKSTMLNGLSDLLFGIEERTPYGFRHGMSELAIAATIEQGGDAVSLIRRKKRKDPLITDLGQALDESALYPFLGGVDRKTFAKMFGLNQVRLREGGDRFKQAGGAGDQALLEAEGGFRGLGALLGDLDAEAEALFAPTGRTRPINVKLAERREAEERARREAVDERQWAGLKARKAAAEAAREELIARLGVITARLNTLERIRRLRPLLQRLDSGLEELAPLARLTSLPSDAPQRKTDAERALTAGEARLLTLNQALERHHAAAREHVDAALLAEAAALEGVLERRGVYEDRARALPRRNEDLVRLASQISGIKEDAGLLDLPDLPAKIARDQLKVAYEALREARARHARLAEAKKTLQRALDEQTRRLEEIGPVGDLTMLRESLEQAPRDYAQQQASSRRAVEAAERQLALEAAALAPWSGDLGVLTTTAPPADAVIDDARERFAALDAEAAELRRSLAEVKGRIADLEAEIVKLTRGEVLPTEAVVGAARQARDEVWGRIATGGAPAIAAEGARYAELVSEADELADRRQIEADRIAALVVHTTELGRLRARADGLVEQDQRLKDDRAGLDATWAARCKALGFAAAITPTELAAWSTTRKRVLAFQTALAEVTAGTEALAERNSAKLEALRRALAKIDTTAAPADPDEMVTHGAGLVRRLDERRLERQGAVELVAKLKADMRSSAEEIATEASRLEALESSLEAASMACGLPARCSEIAITAALEGFEAWAQAANAHEQMQDRVAVIQLEVEDFEGDVRALHTRLELTPPEDVSGGLRGLGERLKLAQAARSRVEQAERQAAEAAAQVSALELSLSAARLDLAQLMELAGASDLAALENAISKDQRRSALKQQLHELEIQIEAASDGLPLCVDQSDVAASDPEAVVVEIETLNAERFELGDRREAASTELAEASREVDLHANGASAAAALQDAEDARAEASIQVERYVEARAVAALLRWAIARHRKTRAGPLIRRASSIMNIITRGDFSGLELDFEGSDEPVVVGIRSSGEQTPSSVMSEGTRDQLYLSLRLAAVEERAARHALPFLADDLLVNGDDERCTAIFGALGQLSQSCQVLCFTHHEHLIGLAENALGPKRYHLHRLTKQQAVMA